MKKVLALILALMMLLMTGCGNKLSDLDPDAVIEAKGGTVSGFTEKPSGGSTLGGGSSENDKDDEEPQAVEKPEANENLTYHENTLFTVGYDESLDWLIKDGEAYIYEKSGSVYLRILDEDGDTDIYVYINAGLESAYDFRESLYARGVDQMEYANGNVETVTFGGQKALIYDSGSTYRYYYGRNEKAGASFELYTNARDDERINCILDSVWFEFDESVDNVEIPWYWEGEPISGDTLTAEAGGFTLTGEFIPFEESIVTHETFNHDVAVSGDYVYIVSDGMPNIYEFDGSSLSYVESIAVDDEYDLAEGIDSGDVILSGFMRDAMFVSGTEVLGTCEGPDKFAVAPDGTWGISYFSSGDSCVKAEIDGTKLTEAGNIIFDEVDIISILMIDDEYVYVAGSPSDGSGHHVFVYDHDFDLQYTLGAAKDDTIGLGSMTFMGKTDNGFIGLDGNMRKVVLWDEDGNHIGAIDDSELFGTSYPWFASADMMDDGSILCVMTEERADESADELIAFRLSGF